jgi:hypothetical protein
VIPIFSILRRSFDKKTKKQRMNERAWMLAPKLSLSHSLLFTTFLRRTASGNAPCPPFWGRQGNIPQNYLYARIITEIYTNVVFKWAAQLVIGQRLTDGA